MSLLPRPKVAFSTWYLSVSRIGSSLAVPDSLELLGIVIRLPWWFPGAGFKKEAEMWKRNIERCRDGLYETVKTTLVRTMLHYYPYFGLFSWADRTKAQLYLQLPRQ